MRYPFGREADFGPSLFQVVSGPVNPPHLVQLGTFAPDGNPIEQLVTGGLEPLIRGPVRVALFIGHEVAILAKSAAWTCTFT